jgi:hypothetical protein
MERIIDSRLRYVDAARLTTPFGSLGGVELVGAENNKVGRLDGVLIDPRERQLRFFVVESRGWFTTRHYLLSVRPTRIEREQRALRVDIDPEEVSRLPIIHPDALPPFSDEDLIGAMFAQNVG